MSVLDGVDRVVSVGGAGARSSTALPASVSAPSSTARTPAVVALVVAVLALVLQLGMVGTAASVPPTFGAVARTLRDMLSLDLPPLWGTFGDERERALDIQTSVFFALFFLIPLPPAVAVCAVARKAAAARRDVRLALAQVVCVAMVVIAAVAGRTLAVH